jgi:hypothetical protein
MGIDGGNIFVDDFALLSSWKRADNSDAQSNYGPIFLSMFVFSARSDISDNIFRSTDHRRRVTLFIN